MTSNRFGKNEKREAERMMELKCETCSHVTCTYAKKVGKNKKKELGVEQIILTKNKPGLYS